MEKEKKVLHMAFITEEGGLFKISIDNTLDTITKEDINNAMDLIIESGVFKTTKGKIVKKSKAYYLNQQVNQVEII